MRPYRSRQGVRPNRVTVLMALVATLGVLPIAVASSGSNAQRGEMDMRIRAVIDADDDLDAPGSIQQLFERAGAEGLRELRASKHLGIALRAAWEDVRRGIPKDEQKQFVRPIGGSEHRFVGFAEGRLSTPIPDWWESTILKVQFHHRDSCYFDTAPKELHPTGDGRRAPKGTSLRRSNDRWILSIGTEALDVTHALSELDKEHGKLECINAHYGRKYAYVALHFGRCYSYGICCIERASGRVRWRARVRATGGLVSYGGQGWHLTLLDVKDDCLRVFGAGEDTVYVEGFHAETGTNVFRFCTSY
jgi:hypothetical protein